MNDKKEIDTIGRRFSQYKKAIGLSLNSLSKIIGISQGTLSRIENDVHRIIYENIKILSEAFGVTVIQFQDKTFPVPHKKKLIESLILYSKNHNRDINVKALIEGSNTAYYLDKYIEDKFLDTYKSMTQIRNEIKEEFDVELSGAQMSKLLLKRYEWGIVNRKAGDKKGTYKYKRIK